jgi:hypothetical protein
MLLRQEILDNGKSRHRLPWIAPDLAPADLRDPKLHPMDTAGRTSRSNQLEFLTLEERSRSYHSSLTLEERSRSNHSSLTLEQ